MKKLSTNTLLIVFFFALFGLGCILQMYILKDMGYDYYIWGGVVLAMALFLIIPKLKSK